MCSVHRKSCPHTGPLPQQASLTHSFKVGLFPQACFLLRHAPIPRDAPSPGRSLPQAAVGYSSLGLSQLFLSKWLVNPRCSITWCRQLGKQDMSPEDLCDVDGAGCICGNKLPKKYGMAEVTTGSWFAGPLLYQRRMETGRSRSGWRGEPEHGMWHFRVMGRTGKFFSRV